MDSYIPAAEIVIYLWREAEVLGGWVVGILAAFYPTAMHQFHSFHLSNNWAGSRGIIDRRTLRTSCHRLPAFATRTAVLYLLLGLVLGVFKGMMDGGERKGRGSLQILGIFWLGWRMKSRVVIAVFSVHVKPTI